MMCFMHKVSYGYDLVPVLNNFIFTDAVLRVMHQSVVSVSGNFGCMLRGSPSSGKKAIVKSLSTILGRNLFECDFSQKSPQLVQ